MAFIENKLPDDELKEFIKHVKNCETLIPVSGIDDERLIKTYNAFRCDGFKPSRICGIER
jgi:hypothetical protein